MNHTISNKPTKVYIIRLSNNKKSVDYAKNAADSCDKLGVEWEYFEGFDHWSVMDLVMKSGIKVWDYNLDMGDGAASASFSHFKLWQKIRDNKEIAIVLEHDALLLHKLELDVPDNLILNLGYKVCDQNSYDHMKAGAPQSIVEVDRHAGAHAYAITYKTADFLLKEIEKIGFHYSIDAAYFLPPRQIAASSIKIAITDPVCAIGWLRESTIDGVSSNFNFKMVESFTKNFKPIKLVHPKKPIIAFLDYSDTVYNPAMLKKQGFGGTETAVMSMAKELSSDYNVFVFNNTNLKGIFDNVYYYNYRDTTDIDYQYQAFDILISVRSVLPFIPEGFSLDIWDQYKFNLQHVFSLVKNSKYKILWAHDTITTGEEWLEYLFYWGHLNNIIVLSDYQYNLYLNKKEEFPYTIKSKLFRTRNGIDKVNNIEISNKDPNLFIFTSAYVKGMRALLEEVWPEVKKEIPQAKLQIVGGSYKELKNEDYEIASYWDKEFIKARQKYNNTLDIEFVGFKTKDELNRYYEKASYLLFPSEYPETFGLTILEAINNNVCIITNKYGALEEVCPEDYCFLINGKFKKEQVGLFVDAAKKLYYDKSLKEKIMTDANKYKDLFLWHNIANEWDLFFTHLLKLPQDQNKLQKNQEYFRKIIQFFNQRIINN